MSDTKPIDVDDMSDEELDTFLDTHTEMGSDLTDSDVVDEPEEEEEEVPSTEEEEEVTPTEEEEDIPEESPTEEEEEVATVDLSAYSQEELGQMSGVYDDLFKTGIKAAGTNRKVRDAEHLKTLVRIGLGANENNRKVKPYLKQLKSLEQAGVSLEDGNINFLVDLLNGDKDAIKELITNRHKIDEDTLHEWLDGENAEEGIYQPKDHVISESRFQLEEILDEIKGNDTYGQTVEFLGSVDDDGKVLVSENPELAKLINNDMENGYFQTALDEAHFRMDRGLLPKQSILQSYINVMQDPDFYKKLVGGQEESAQVTDDRSIVETKKKDVVKRKKRINNSENSNAPAPKRGASTKLKPGDVDRMSEEDYDEMFASLGLDD